MHSETLKTMMSLSTMVTTVASHNVIEKSEPKVIQAFVKPGEGQTLVKKREYRTKPQMMSVQ